MRLITCCECGEQKKETEFEYLFFQKKYKKTCKSCYEKNKKPE